jgi:hypothetical protein
LAAHVVGHRVARHDLVLARHHPVSDELAGLLQDQGELLVIDVGSHLPAIDRREGAVQY